MQNGSPVAMTRGGALDALRILAAVFIVVFHFGDNAPTRLQDIHAFFSRGNLATNFFLMLSGFILARVYGAQVLSGRMSTVQFVSRRLTRIYPAHLITLAAMIALVVLGGLVGLQFSHPERFDWSALPAHLLLVNGWGFTPATWNLPTWSLSALAACYLSFPWMWRKLQLIDRPLICLGIALVAMLGGDVLTRALTGERQLSVSLQWGLLRAVPLFIVGLVLARMVEVWRPGVRAARVAAIGGAAVFVVSAVMQGPDLVNTLATMAVVAGLGGGASRSIWPGAAWGAEVSFSLFITHIPAAVFYFDAMAPLLARLPQGAAAQWAIWGGALTFSLVVAAAFHHGMDEPIQRRLRAALFRPRPALGSASTQGA